MKRIFYCSAAALLLLCWCTTARAVEMRGTVRSATANSVTIAIEGESAPIVGDSVEIYFKMPGVDEEISVGSGKVTAVTGDSVEAKIDKATGTVSKDQLVHITSEKPQKRTAAPARQGTIPTGTMSAFEGIPPTQIVFDDLPPAPLPADAFAGKGIHFIKERGTPAVYEIQPNMLMPPSRKRILLVTDDRVTSLSITFDRPVRRFTLVRIGTTGGASIPTWTMVAYDQTGKVLKRAGEEHGSPPAAKEFSVQGDGIARVELNTDNRLGEGTWATWNSLPVSECVFEP
jgi:hypothetical protein